MFLRIFFSIISILVGFSALIVFFCMKNYEAALGGFISGVFSVLQFHLHRLKFRNGISEYYTPSSLWNLGWLGYAGFAVGVSAFIYNMIIYIFLHIPIMPVEGSNLISAIWYAIAAKSGFLLFYYARKYSRFVETVPVRQPLLPARTTTFRPQEIAPGPQSIIIPENVN